MSGKYRFTSAEQRENKLITMKTRFPSLLRDNNKTSDMNRHGSRKFCFTQLCYLMKAFTRWDQITRLHMHANPSTGVRTNVKKWAMDRVALIHHLPCRCTPKKTHIHTGEKRWHTHWDGTKPSLQQRTEPQRGRRPQSLLVFPPADPHGYRHSPTQGSHREAGRKAQAERVGATGCTSPSHSCICGHTLFAFFRGQTGRLIKIKDSQ